MNKLELQKKLNKTKISISEIREHSKASEKYVDVIIVANDGNEWKGSIPFFYRRTGLLINSEQELAEYLESIYPLFTGEAIENFQKKEKLRWSTGEYSGKKTTKGFFDKLIGLEWVHSADFPVNNNPARRIQDIKEYGYTLATDTNKAIGHKKGNFRLLVPIPKGGVTGYETMSKEFRSMVVKTLNQENIYELSKANIHGLLPDHKFPEIRWDKNTKKENSQEMSKEKIIKKFQLIDNQRNQQKREVCRQCFQTGKRGIIYGVNFFYKGTIDWDNTVPKVGADAEKGCVGCGWYDIKKWREELNKTLSSK